MTSKLHEKMVLNSSDTLPALPLKSYPSMTGLALICHLHFDLDSDPQYGIFLI